MSPTHLPGDPRDGPDTKLWRIYRAIKCRLTSNSFASTVGHPIVPLLILGAMAAHVIATCVFDAPALGFVILFLGSLTAFLEAKMHKDHDDR